MNKDLAGFSRFGVHFSGCGVAAFTACPHVVKEPPKMVLRRMMGPSVETDAVFRCCTVGELLQDCDSVSVMTVQEKCDEKGLGAASGHRNVRGRQFGRAPFVYRSGQAFSKSARRGAPPVISCQHSKTPAL